jgi:hypothetical protein
VLAGLDEGAVRDPLESLRNRDRDVEGRLVEKRVVARVPGDRPARLVHGERPVVGFEPALLRAVRIGDRAGAARVGDLDDKRGAECDRRRRGDDELAAVALVGGLHAVHPNRAHLRTCVVQVEGAQVLARSRVEARLGDQLAVARVVAQVEVVVIDRVAAVAGVGEEAVAEPSRSRGRLGSCRAGEPEDGGGCSKRR